MHTNVRWQHVQGRKNGWRGEAPPRCCKVSAATRGHSVHFFPPNLLHSTCTIFRRTDDLFKCRGAYTWTRGRTCACAHMHIRVHNKSLNYTKTNGAEHCGLIEGMVGSLAETAQGRPLYRAFVESARQCKSEKQ